MPRVSQRKPFTAKLVQQLTSPGTYADGNNLYLQVRGPDRRSWLFRYMRRGRARAMGLGSADDVSLAEARLRAAEARAVLASGRDPLDDRAADHAAAVARAITFATAADHYFTAHQAGWSRTYATDERAAVTNYAIPVMGAVPVADVGTADVLRALEPIWRTKTTTASALRARIEAVLSYATVQGWRQGPNPAIWRGNLALLLPAPRKLRTVEHHAALRWQDIPAFMRELRARDTISARCLEFTILTAVRSGEARDARWEEIDLDAAVWSIPAERMKARGELRVPLTAPAIELLRCIEPLAVDGFIFPGRSHKPGRRLAAQPMNDATLRKLLEKMGRGDLTVHGFRSTFKDWASESTDAPR